MPAKFSADVFSDLSNNVSPHGTHGVIVSKTPNSKPLIGVMKFDEQGASFLTINEKTPIQCKYLAIYMFQMGKIEEKLL
jgi:hypothetical protein